MSVWYISSLHFVQEEKKNLEVLLQNKKLCLAKQHQHEVELQRLGEIIDTDKFKELAESFTRTEEEPQTNTEDLQTRLKALEEQKKEVEEEVENLKDDNESYTITINVLTNQHRTVNDELSEALKLAVKVMVGVSNFLQTDPQCCSYFIFCFLVFALVRTSLPNVVMFYTFSPGIQQIWE